MRFTKMHGIGNDYVYVDCVRNPPPADPAAVSRAVSDRHFGVGSDGLILIEGGVQVPFRPRTSFFGQGGVRIAQFGTIEREGVEIERDSATGFRIVLKPR